MGRVERIMIDLLHPNPHVKKLKVFLQIRSCQQQPMKFRQLLWSSTEFCVIAFPYATISLVNVHDRDTVKENTFLFSASSSHNLHRAVGETHFVP